jgi:hypothetical protein
MKRPDEKLALTDELSKGTATGLPAMKRSYEKPTLTDLSRPDARAGWLSGDRKASPMELCTPGATAGYSAFNNTCNDGSGANFVCNTGSQVGVGCVSGAAVQ